MVWVDFSNAWLRGCFPRWLAEHRDRLGAIADELGGWAAAPPPGGRGGASPPLPPAIVLDIDEVLLCNTHLNGHGDFHVADFFRRGGAPWGRADTRDPPLPGAVELVARAAGLGVEVFLVTGRLEKIRAVTIADLAPFDLGGLGAGPGTRLIMCPEEPEGSIQPFKEAMRARIAESHRILANVGDQASDLGRHGERQIHLPHPFYYTP